MINFIKTYFQKRKAIKLILKWVYAHPLPFAIGSVPGIHKPENWDEENGISDKLKKEIREKLSDPEYWKKANPSEQK